MAILLVIQKLRRMCSRGWRTRSWAARRRRWAGGGTAAKWTVAQDRYDAQIIKQYGEIRIFGQTTPKSLKEIFTDVFVLDQPTAMRRFDPEAVRDHLWNKDRGEPWRASERLPAEELLSRVATSSSSWGGRARARRLS